MGINLRLGDELAAALSAESARTGRSQQSIIREALAKELGLNAGLTGLERAVRAGLVDPPAPFVDAKPFVTLPSGTTSTLELLDRDDR